MPEVPSANSIYQHPKFDTFDALCVIHCLFSKKTILIPGHTKYAAADWAVIILKFLFLCDWGLPVYIVSDRDPKFTSDLWREIYRILEVRLLLSTSYHSQTNGGTERKNQTVEIAIRFHVIYDPDVLWIVIIPALQHRLNNTLATSINRSPNELTLGFRPRSVTDLLANPSTALDKLSKNKDALDILRKTYQEEAAALIDIASAIAKDHYDRHHEPVDFKVGDEVYIRLNKGYHLPGKPKPKWSQARMGKLRIIRKVHDLAYKLDIPAHWRIHPVISAAMLYKPPQGKDPFDRTESKPRPIMVNGQQEWEVERIVDRHIKLNKNGPVVKYWIKWKGYSPHENTLEPVDNLGNAKDMIDKYERQHPIDIASLYRKSGKPVPPNLSRAQG
jgi:hypothetical protein